MTRFIQTESASSREIRAAGPDQIGGRLASQTPCFKPVQSNSNRFKPKNTENRFPSNPGLYRLLPPVTAHYGLLPPKNARRDFPPGAGLSGAYRQSAAPKKCENRHLAAFHPDLTGPNRSYPDLKNVKTRLVLGPWSFFIGTFLELVEDPDPIGGTWSLELLLPTAPAPALDPLVNWCCLVLKSYCCPFGFQGRGSGRVNE